MSNLLKAIRGMNDITPAQVRSWQHIETVLRQIVESYGYQEIRFPLLEQTALFKRSIGDVTDIVEKEMYSFEDRNGDNLSLRPEGTACCVRAALEHGLLHHQTPKLWYQGPFYRHERPQKGRYRQFHQLGAEAFGIDTPDIEAELIALSAMIFERLGLSSKVNLHINTIGNLTSRQCYRTKLQEYFAQYRDQLDEDSLRRLETNPLRILDSKNPALAELIAEAPTLTSYLEPASQQRFDQLLAYLDAMGIRYTLNSTLVRGLDYYNDTVFEWVTQSLGAQATVCAGGRYDGLVAQLGGSACCAVGFGIGIERLLLLLNDARTYHCDVYVIAQGSAAQTQALRTTQTIRRALPQLTLLMHCGTAGLKSQFKQADKSGAIYALILGEEEIAQQKVTLKYLREEKPQQMLALEDAIRLIST